MRLSLGVGLGLDQIGGGEGGSGTAPLYLPAVSVAPALAAGLKPLVAGYSGPALRVVRASDSAEQDIGFVGPRFDADAALAFQGASSLTGKTLYDQSGAGRNLTGPTANAGSQVMANQRPLLTLGAGGPALVSFNASRPLVIPAMTLDRRDMTVFMVARVPGQGAAAGCWMFGDGSNADFGLRTNSNQFNLQPIVAGSTISAGAQNWQAQAHTRMGVIAHVSSAAKQVAHRDDQTVEFAAAAAGSLTLGGVVGSTFTIAGRFDLAAFVVYPAALSDGDVAAVKEALRAIFSAQQTAARSILATGDSIVFGTGGVNNVTITAELGRITPASVLIRNTGIAGHALSGHYTDFDSPTSRGRFTTPGVQNVFVANYGHNDIKQQIDDGASAGDVVALLIARAKLMCADLRLAGFDRIIWQECLADARNSATWTPAMESARLDWNAALRANFTDANGVVCFNGVDLVASDDAFVLSDYETAQGRGMASSANSSDALHPNESVAAARAAHLLAAIEASIATPVSISGTPVTSATEDVAYVGFTVSAANGAPPYTFSVSSGALPPGITLDPSSGVVSGAPTTVGAYAGIVIRATDAGGDHANLAPFTITVAAASALLLDGLSASAAGAYSLRKLRGAYGGAAIRVRRSTDNAELDIGFAPDGSFDASALTGFIGAASGFVAAWYDQSGNGLDMTQATAGSQPRIVAAGAMETRNGLAAILFASSQGVGGNLSASPAAGRTVALVSSHNNNNNDQIMNPSANGGWSMRWGGAQTLQIIKAGTGVIATSTGVATLNQLHTAQAEFTGTAYAFLLDGAAAGSGAASQTFTAGLTQRFGLQNLSNSHYAELIVFDGAALSSGDKAAIQTDQKTYYGTA